MQYMIDIKVLNVFAGNDVDLFIPLAVQRFQAGKLFFLTKGKIGEIMRNDFCVLHNLVNGQWSMVIRFVISH